MTDHCADDHVFYVAANAKSLTVELCTRCPAQRVHNSKDAPGRSSVTGRMEKTEPLSYQPIYQHTPPPPPRVPGPLATPIRHKPRVRITHWKE